jgi:hypothetical protein
LAGCFRFPDYGHSFIKIFLFCSIWIMDHLNHNMMAMTAMRGAQPGFKSPL